MRIVRRRAWAVVGFGIVSAVLVAPAGAARVGWHEAAADGRVSVLSFRIDTLSLGKKSWSARVTVKNDSRKRILIGNEFGVEIFTTKAETNLEKGLAFGHATSFSPRLPTELGPGQAWSGTIAGAGHPPTSSASRYARLVFGPFVGVPGEHGAILWVTNHALKLPGTGSSPTAA